MSPEKRNDGQTSGLTINRNYSGFSQLDGMFSPVTVDQNRNYSSVNIPRKLNGRNVDMNLRKNPNNTNIPQFSNTEENPNYPSIRYSAPIPDPKRKLPGVINTTYKNGGFVRKWGSK